MATVVAIAGTRYPDFAIEEAVFAPHQIGLRSGDGDTEDSLIALADDAAAVVVGSRPRFSADVIRRIACPVIVRAGIGYDNIDLEAARRAGKQVAYVPDYGTEAVAQHTLSLALSGARRLTESHHQTVSGDWGFAGVRPLHLPSAMTAGVIGYGRIGRRVAELLAAVGFGTVLAHDAYVTPTGTVEPVDLETLLESSDVVTLHVPGPGDGSPLITGKEVSLMKPGSVIVNTARGSLIDPQALARGLASGAPRVAALDVFSPEPPDLEPFGEVLDRMILTPHMAWYTEESQADLRRKSAEEALRILRGEAPLNPLVTPEED